jgi:hypothetical protein
MIFERNLPTSKRLTTTQRLYIVANQDEFGRMYDTAIKAQAEQVFARWLSQNQSAKDDEVEAAIEAASLFALNEHARIFCEMHRVV